VNLADPTTQTWIAISGWLIGAVSLIIAIITTILYLKDRKTKKPRWSVQTVPIIQGSVTQIPGLEVLYNGMKATDFSRTNVRFWNDGNDPIRQLDIAPNNPLHVVYPPKVVVYNVSGLEPTSSGTRTELKHWVEDHRIDFSFDYLEKGEAVELSIYHGTAKSRDFELKGIIIGARIRNAADIKPLLDMRKFAVLWAMSGILLSIIGNLTFDVIGNILNLWLPQASELLDRSHTFVLVLGVFAVTVAVNQYFIRQRAREREEEADS
jgi:hypothetical protein